MASARIIRGASGVAGCYLNEASFLARVWSGEPASRQEQTSTLPVATRLTWASSAPETDLINRSTVRWDLSGNTKTFWDRFAEYRRHFTSNGRINSSLLGIGPFVNRGMENSMGRHFH